MGDAHEGIGWLLQCGISYLFDPHIEGAVINGGTHMLLSPFFSLRRSGSSREWDFDGYVKHGVQSIHGPHAVLVSELLNNLANLHLVSDRYSARGECLPTGLEADGRGLAHVFVPAGP